MVSGVPARPSGVAGRSALPTAAPPSFTRIRPPLLPPAVPAAALALREV